LLRIQDGTLQRYNNVRRGVAKTMQGTKDRAINRRGLWCLAGFLNF
jgi:hypothetical protein